MDRTPGPLGTDQFLNESSPFNSMNTTQTHAFGHSVIRFDSLQDKYAGIYVGARGIQGGGLVGTHQFLVLIPNDVQRFPPPYVYAANRLAPGVHGIVVGAYNIEFEDSQNRLMMEFFQGVDLNAARQLVQGMLHQNGDGSISDCDEAKQTLLEYYMRAPIPIGVIDAFQSACRATPRGLQQVNTQRNIDGTIERIINSAIKYKQNESNNHVAYPGGVVTVFSADACLNSNSWVQTLLEVGVDRSASGQNLDRYDACRENRFDHSLFK